ncbi:efflux RND transporter periplasmic adaptor subunit [Acuticoccus kandeliae]|uniref:efflux RND transporter periplasmic adaptor subunit n=1 Tax=Acuticoccus kandeliae TaxID=2073160 RepID=UPI000D3E1321|nr:efflux RND transporter periplasmic adaptor subunit [Acuticoccus kandeliae]
MLIGAKSLAALSVTAALGLATAVPALAQAPGGGPPRAVPVTVVTLKAENVTLTSTLPGRVVASGVAQVRPQVAGIITERLFEEGSDVTIGDTLYRIDPATYEALVAQARAQVTQAEAQLKQAERELERASQLFDRRVSSEQVRDAAIAQRDTAQAALEVAKAAQQSAEIDLERTTIKAQLTGVIGRSLTTKGALVTSGQETPLAIIRDIDPVLVDVTQSAAEMLAWRKGVTQQKLSNVDDTVTLILADGEAYEHTGRLRAAEPYVNEQTGVVTLRLEFPNPDRLLLPGMYVQVQMPQGVADNVVLAPQEGVARDRRGRPTAYVVGADNVVEERVLTIEQSQGADWIVTDGLKDGDRMIVEGVQKVRPGATVAPQERVASAEGVAAVAQ